MMRCGPWRKAAGIGALALAAGAAALPHRSARLAAPATVRVALVPAVQQVDLSATGGWDLVAPDGRVVMNGRADAALRVEREGATLRGVRTDGARTPAREGPLTFRPVGSSALAAVAGRRYRGDLLLYATDSGIVAVNRLPIEDYLRGVVPLEIGKRLPAERAAIEAQAVAARSYTHTRLALTASGWYDVRASVLDQAYGGADAETQLTDSAVWATRGMVLTYGGRVVSAPYSSTCGGTTAGASEVWKSSDQPFLAAVSDRIPGTDRFYCDASPRFRWTRAFDRPGLEAALSRYLRAYTAVPSSGVGAVLSVAVDGHTASGRVRGLAVRTESGQYTLRGNEMRFVLRTPNGEILPSTYFSLEAESRHGAPLERLVLRGTGNGHGVGMCQWGAIGRARAGQDFRAILHAYYPGTKVERVE